MTYWRDTSPPIEGDKKIPANSTVAIIGSGLAGVSVAYWLTQLTDMTNIQIVDCGTENASFFRNAGHILHGTGESYKAMHAIHGPETAKKIMHMSQTFCEDMGNTITNLNLDCDYIRGNYYFIGKDNHEGQEISEAVSMLNRDGFVHSHAMTKRYGEMQGFVDLDSLRWCKLSASANPAKFRNELLKKVLSSGVAYNSCKVLDVREDGDKVCLEHPDGKSYHDFVVLCTNAYTRQIYAPVQSKGSIEPYKGQIIVSKPLNKTMPKIAFSSDHGYMYGTITADNRILIGGWRNNVPGMETNTYDLTPNPVVENGLKEWVGKHIHTEQEVEWEYSWAGIMGSSSNKGLPMVGQTKDQLIWMCAGFTGYGFGWAHGCARMLVNMMIGSEDVDGHELLDPRGL